MTKGGSEDRGGKKQIKTRGRRTFWRCGLESGGKGRSCPLIWAVESLREEPPREACPGSRTTSGRSPQDPPPRRGECEAEEKKKKGLSTVKVRNDLLVEG